MDTSEGGKEQRNHKSCLQEPPGLRQGRRHRWTCTGSRTGLATGESQLAEQEGVGGSRPGAATRADFLGADVRGRSERK